jgi:hypothetical protein
MTKNAGDETASVNEQWEAEPVYTSQERKGISHHCVMTGSGADKHLIATHIPTAELAAALAANPELFKLAEAVVAAFSENGEHNSRTAEHSTADLRALAAAALAKAKRPAPTPGVEGDA